MTKSFRVDVLAYEDCFAAEIFGVLDVLTIANAVSASLRPNMPAPFIGRVVSVRGGAVAVSGGIRMQTARAGQDTDQLVVPGCALDSLAGLESRLSLWAREIGYLSTFDGDRQTSVASVCLGAFLLADAGLLSGRRATTAWLFAPELARRHPDVDVQATAMIVRDGPIATTGAFSAVLDFALHLVHRHAGDEVGGLTARIALVQQPRVSQAPFVDEALLPVAHSRFSDDVREWLRRHLADRYDLDRLAREYHVSTRTLLRRFKAETGESPLSYLRGVRVRTAKRLLETSDLGVHEITERVGYTDAATFRALFIECVGVTPSEYRRQFSRSAA